MEEQTLNASKDLIKGVYEDVYNYLFENPKWHDKLGIADEIDDAIRELESWRGAVLRLPLNQNIETKNQGEQ